MFWCIKLVKLGWKSFGSHEWVQRVGKVCSAASLPARRQHAIHSGQIGKGNLLTFLISILFWHIKFTRKTEMLLYQINQTSTKNDVSHAEFILCTLRREQIITRQKFELLDHFQIRVRSFWESWFTRVEIVENFINYLSFSPS